jgi:LPXTG-motif cell wall-anchored protein
MNILTRTILSGLCTAFAAVTLLAQDMPKTTTEAIKGASTSTTKQVSGTVLQVEGNTLVVRMSGGGIQEFTPPESRKFIIDGKELTVHDLQPGTKLTATVTTTTTPVTDRTTTVGSGKVWYVAGNTVILTLPNNENRMYKVQESYKFIVNGKPATVHDLRKGMTVSAEKIVESPRTEIATNTEVTGHAPPPPKTETAAAAPAPAPAHAPKPAPKAAPAPAPAPPPAQEAKAEAPAKLPKTGSPIPLFGFLGVTLTSASFALRKLRRK